MILQNLLVNFYGLREVDLGSVWIQLKNEN